MAAENDMQSMSPTPTLVASCPPTSTNRNEVWNAQQVPFEKCKELYRNLQYVRDREKPAYLHHHGSTPTLPDAPRIRLDCPLEMISYCLDDLNTPELNKLGEKLWWAGPTPDIVSLTQHMVLDRKIQITEDPSVHLLWDGFETILFAKPLPAYLTSFEFWEYMMDQTNSDVSAEQRSLLIATSLGFLKTYAKLIQRRSDFNLARRHDLLGSFGDISFEAFVAFIECFDNIPDEAISSRWLYGLIQLDALNFHSAIHLRHWHLNRFESRYSTYFSRFFPVVLFIFALLSVMLSAMQVIIGAKQMWETDNKGLKRALGIFVWTSTEAIGWSLGFGLLFVMWWIVISTNEAWSRRKAQKKIKKRLKAEGVGP